MSGTLYGYYERELSFIRRMAHEFAGQYPAAAGHLLLEPNRSVDPHVERLIESFALIAGRIRHKLDDEFPELTDALLGVLYPHYLAPIPSMAVVQLEVDAKQAQSPRGFTVARGSRLRTQPVGDLACKFRTGYPVTLWPIRVAEARLAQPPFPPGVEPPPRAAAVLRLRLECRGGAAFANLAIDRLRLFLDGERPLVAGLYELIFNHAIRVVLRPADAGADGPAPIAMDAGDCLAQVGFEREEGLLPYPNQSFPGYRLLTEFFTFPEKFQFLDLKGLDAAGRAGYPARLEVLIYLDRTAAGLEQRVNAETFRLGCTPAVNLFEQTAEPIPLTQTRSRYRIVPDVAHPQGMEVYSVDAVTATDPDSRRTTTFQPFYSFRHGADRAAQQAFWYASRGPSVGPDDRGTEVSLGLVDLQFSPKLPAESTLVVWTTCTNRDLPARLHELGERLDFTLEAAAPVDRVRCLRSPTVPLRPPPRRGAYWRLVSHLSLNHLSLGDEVEGCEALREILRLYDFSDPEAGESMAAVNRQLIDGIIALGSRRVVGRLGDPAAGGFCRGTEITVEFDEQKYVGTGVFLFACILERFFALYASINSFTQLIATTKQGEGPFRRWPPRAGDQPMI